MFPFRPSRAVAALLEVAEAMLAPEAFDAADGDVSAAPHPHRNAPTVDRRRRPSPPRPDHGCLTPLTRARTRQTSRA